MADALMIDRRFRGPPDSANGGYTCALAARAIDGPAEVTLRTPPPLGRPLELERRGETAVLLAGGEVIAEATATSLDADVPAPVSVEHARRASSRYPWHEGHPYPTCFVCGPQREHGDGLRIFPGPLDDGSMFAAAWSPDHALADDHHTVLPEFAWAALDCPSGIVTDMLGANRRILLGRLAADLRAPLTAGLPYVVMAWPVARDGRKLHTGAALFSAEGDLCAVARAVWIELRPQPEERT